MKSICTKFFVFAGVFLLVGCTSSRDGRGGGRSSNKGTEIQDVQQKKAVVENVAANTTNVLGDDFKVDALIKMNGSFSTQSSAINGANASLSFKNAGLSATLLADFPETLQTEADINKIQASVKSKGTGSITGKMYGGDVSFDCSGDFINAYLYQNNVYLQIFDNPYLSLISLIESDTIPIGKFYTDDIVFQLSSKQEATIRIGEFDFDDAMGEIKSTLDDLVEQGYLTIYESESAYVFDVDYTVDYTHNYTVDYTHPNTDRVKLFMKASYKVGKDFKPVELSGNVKFQKSEQNSVSSTSINLTIDFSAKLSYLSNPTIVIPGDLSTYERIA